MAPIGGDVLLSGSSGNKSTSKLSAEFSPGWFVVGLRSHFWLALSHGWALLLEAVRVPSNAFHVAPPVTAGHVSHTLCISLTTAGEDAVLF